MANKQIGDLSPTVSLSESDIVHIQSGSADFYMTIGNLITKIRNLSTYDTGWIGPSTSWVNQLLGSTQRGQALTHNLGVPLPELQVEIWFSTAGTDATAQKHDGNTYDGGADAGISLYAIDDNSFYVQTGQSGAGLILTYGSGAGNYIESGENWYYRIIVRKL